MPYLILLFNEIKKPKCVWCCPPYHGHSLPDHGNRRWLAQHHGRHEEGLWRGTQDSGTHSCFPGDETFLLDDLPTSQELLGKLW